MATQDEYNTEAVRALAAMTPGQRARQQFANTLTNFGNTVSFGGLGALGDVARGTPWGTTGGQIAAQLDAQAPGARAVSTGLGYIAPTGIARNAVAAAGGARPALSAVAKFFAPAAPLGKRAAELGARADLPIGRTLAKFALPAGIAGLIYGQAENAANAGPAEPASKDLVNLPQATLKSPVADAIAQAVPQTPQDEIAAYIHNVLQRGASGQDIEGLAQLASTVPPLVKQTQTRKDMAIGTASDATDALYKADLSKASKIADPDAKAEAYRKATDDYRKNFAALAGVNPQALTVADIIGNAQQEQ